MADEYLNKEQNSKLVFTMPSQNAKYNIRDLSDRDIKLKDQLMRLIIDTKR